MISIPSTTVRWALVLAVVSVILLLAGRTDGTTSANEGGKQVGTGWATGDLNNPTGPWVLAYFYYWYDLPSGPHSTALTDRPYDAYTSFHSVSWFKTQFEDMTAARVDVALAAYWGDLEPSSLPGLTNMGTAAAELRSQGKTPPKIAMFLDTGAIGQWPTAQRDLTVLANQEKAYGMIYDFYSTLPRSEWGTINDQPIVWLWGAYFGITADQSFFDYISSNFVNDFGVYPWIVAEVSWKYENSSIIANDYYQWGASLDGFQTPLGDIAQIGPGYDERELTGPGRTGRYRSRSNGDFYRDSFAAAIASGKPYIAIETWNEFHEASDIAHSIEYGRTYIDITREYADELRKARIDADGDGLADDQQVDGIRAAAQALPLSAFRSGAERTAFFDQVELLDSALRTSHLIGVFSPIYGDFAREVVVRPVLDRLEGMTDGCGSGADSDDAIVTCTGQNAVRPAITELRSAADLN